jgi:hypothetical protein
MAVAKIYHGVKTQEAHGAVAKATGRKASTQGPNPRILSADTVTPTLQVSH